MVQDHDRVVIHHLTPAFQGGISLLERFFTANQVVFHFADGLVFFMLGAVAALAAHTFRESRMAVARALPWLAGFGVLVGAAKWGVVFIPLQAVYLPADVLGWLHHLHGGLLVAGHGALLLFGLRLIPGRSRERWLLPAAFVAGGLAFGLALLMAGRITWESLPRALAAYGLGLPGAVLSWRGLYLQGEQLGSFYPGPAGALRRAAWAFLISAPLGPLAIPLEGGHSFRLAGVPVEVLLIGGGLFLTLALFSGLEALRVENLRRIERAERREAMLEERYRLAKELNDGVIQDLVATGMLMGAVEPDVAEVSRPHIRLMERQLQGAVERLRTYLMDLQPMDWEEPDLYRGLRMLVAEFQANSLLPVQLDLQEGLTVAPPVGRQLYMVVYEALSNVRRHACARQVRVALRPQGSDWLLEIADDGEGFDAAAARGPGLERMTAGTARLGGHLRIDSWRGGGTRVIITMPLGCNGTTGAGRSA